MELLLPCSRIVLIMAMVVVLIIPVYGQISTPCNASIISSFTPCMNLLTNSTANGTSPSADCCNSLKSLTSGGLDCLCLIVTGSVPFQIPINRSLAISLPRACNMPGVPVQCKGRTFEENIIRNLIRWILCYSFDETLWDTNASFLYHLQPLQHLFLLQVLIYFQLSLQGP